MVDDIVALFQQIADWQAFGQRVALATVVQTWGSSPRAIGSHLAINESGAFIGSVSGGCIEGVVISEALVIIAERGSHLLEFSVTDDQAWEVGLSCGGRIQVLVQSLDGIRRELFDQLMGAYATKQPMAMVTRLADGAQALLGEASCEGADYLLESASVRAEASRALRTGRSGIFESEELFVRVYPCAARMYVIGAVHIAQFLAPMATQLGFQLTVIDPRRAFATAERFPDIALNTDWPDEALTAAGLTAADAMITLTHDPKLDDPALVVALGSPAFYIGALGSKRTHAQRITRLTALGLGAETHRIHAPVGLALGGRAPAEIAVAILAQIIEQRYAE